MKVWSKCSKPDSDRVKQPKTERPEKKTSQNITTQSKSSEAHFTTRTGQYN